jgi:hypothetical protein
MRRRINGLLHRIDECPAGVVVVMVVVVVVVADQPSEKS